MKISIVTITYNAAQYISHTLESVITQTVRPCEHIFIDGKSSDGTQELIRNYERISNYKVKLVSEIDEGIYDAMNKGLSYVKGDYILYLNAGDYFASKNVLNLYHTNYISKALIYASNINYVDSNSNISREWRLSPYPGNFKSGWHVAHPGFLAEINLLRNLKGFNLEFKIASDFDLMLRAVKSIDPRQMVILDYVTVNMLEGGFSNGSIANILMGNREVRKSIRLSGEEVTIIYTLSRLLIKFIAKIR
jgi:glycosyltransferase involved in cell wall biosynthesis